jgi:hypothetical protein
MNITKHWRWAVAAAAIFVPAVAAGAVTIPFSFTSGTVIKAADVNANFTALKTAVDTLQAVQKPTLATAYDGSLFSLTFVSGQPNPWVSPAWVTGTADVAVPANGKVEADATVTLLADTFAALAPAVQIQLMMCYRVGTGTPTIPLAPGPTGYRSHIVYMPFSSISQSVVVHVHDVFPFAAATTVQFGLCAAAPDVTSVNDNRGRVISVTTTALVIP